MEYKRPFVQVTTYVYCGCWVPSAMEPGLASAAPFDCVTPFFAPGRLKSGFSGVQLSSL